MASNFAKRKMKETVKKDLTNLAFDVILDKNSKQYFGVPIRYNIETGETEVMEKIRISSKTVGMVFFKHKDAIKTLLKIKE